MHYHAPKKHKNRLKNNQKKAQKQKKPKNGLFQKKVIYSSQSKVP